MRRCLAACAIAIAGAAGGAETPARWTPHAIASDQYESSPAFTPDGREMFFMRADTRFQNYRLLWSRCANGAWTPPEPPPFAAAPPVLEADPFVSADGRHLYYVSTRGKPAGSDDLDIWVVARSPGGAWGTPQRLPEPVNSPASELLPRAGADGTLVFGSSRPGGFGQGDIYRAAKQADGRWQVENLGPPISTPANEYEAELSRDGRTMVVVADRGDRSHLYRYERQDGRWVERGRVPADPQVFQVGPLLSPRGQRLLFAQKDDERSGEMFLIDLMAGSREAWPPACER
jgi:Tol biopolymer transport system component